MSFFIPVNASSWLSRHDERYIYYYTGAITSFDASCYKVYRPFAWLRFDTLSNELHGARDHFGQAPFYYSTTDDKFIFGSTIPDILKFLPKRPPLTEHCERDIFSPHEIADPPFRTETYYKGIFRVTPGHLISASDGILREKSYWEISPQGAYLYYKDSAQYSEQFSALLTDAIRELTAGYNSIAAEFSGGIDSTSILIACKSIGLEPKLFTHPPAPGRLRGDEDVNIETILKLFGWCKNYQSVTSASFEPIEIFSECARDFAGPPPYWLGMFNTPIHKEVARQNIPLLLSGFSGDDCFSLRCPSIFGLAERHRQFGSYRTIEEFFGYEYFGSLKYRLIKSSQFVAHSNKKLYKIGAQASNILSLLSGRFKSYHKHEFFDSLRAYQYAVLQGHLCHELRMKIEYDAILARKYNFKFAYPLLYPPLIEFCMQLPPSMLRSKGVMAILARNYVTAALPTFLHNTKTGPFVACTTQKCRDYMDQGLFRSAFVQLPFASQFEKLPDSEEKLLMYVRSYMLKYFQSLPHN